MEGMENELWRRWSGRKVGEWALCLKLHFYILKSPFGAKGDWDFWISDLVKTLMELISNPCSEFRWSLEGPVSQIHSPHLHAGTPGIFSDLLRSVQMLKRQWGAESNGKLPHLFIPSKTATLVPEFAVEDLPLDRNVTLALAFSVKDLPLGRTLWWYTVYSITISIHLHKYST